MSEPIRVFVGCASGGEDAESCAVLEYTLRRHASRPVDLVWMRLSRFPNEPWGGWNTDGWATPFTGLRWSIPAVCSYAGRAIYMDSDMIVRADVAELWDQPIPPGVFALVRETEGKLRTCVMLMDCAQGHWLPDLAKLKAMGGQHGHATAHLKAHRELLARFEGQWNCIDLKRCDGIDDPSVKIIHYSSMAHQPHLKYAARRLKAQGRRHWYDGETAAHWRPELQDLFDRELIQAEAAGFHPAAYDWAEQSSPYRKKSFAGRPAKRVA